jgi:bacillithiol system protein YtxJ
MTLQEAQGALWNKLETLPEWEVAKELSVKESVLIVKHSMTCPISTKAFSRIETGIKQKVLSCPVYVVIVQTARNVSNQIEKDLDVDHESPQVLVMKEGKAIYDTSHLDIDAQTIVSFL